MAEKIKDAAGHETATQDVSKGTDSAQEAGAASSKKWAEGKPKTTEYRVVSGKHARFEAPVVPAGATPAVGPRGKPLPGEHKVYVVGDTIALTDEEAAALNRRGTRIETLSPEEASKVAEARAQVELKQAQARSAARDEGGYSPVGPPGGPGGPGTPNEPVGGVPGKPGGPPLGRRAKPEQDLPAGSARPDQDLPSGPAHPDQGLPETGRPAQPIVEPKPEPKK